MRAGLQWFRECNSWVFRHNQKALTLGYNTSGCVTCISGDYYLSVSSVHTFPAGADDYLVLPTVLKQNDSALWKDTWLLTSAHPDAAAYQEKKNSSVSSPCCNILGWGLFEDTPEIMRSPQPTLSGVDKGKHLVQGVLKLSSKAWLKNFRCQASSYSRRSKYHPHFTEG